MTGKLHTHTASNNIEWRDILTNTDKFFFKKTQKWYIQNMSHKRWLHIYY